MRSTDARIRIRTVLTVAAAALGTLVLTIGSAHAVTITAGSTVPTVDGADIANLDQTNAFSDFGSSFMWPDRPARGQTFRTGANPLGYILDAITMQAYKEALETSNYTLRVGSISGTTFTPMASETGSYDVDIIVSDYVTFPLDDPISLVSDSDYGFDVAITGSDGGFASHGRGPLNNLQTDYADGSGYSSGGGGAGGTAISTHNQDRIFHLNLRAVPEPSALVLAAVGFLCVGWYAWRRKHAKPAAMIITGGGLLGTGWPHSRRRQRA